jgi:predicted AlkP superfamily pyrophosphatase or phosphodiesterase
MKHYYKVHIKNFDSFIDYMIKKYNDRNFDTQVSFLRIKESYNDSRNLFVDPSYLYLSIDDIQDSRYCYYLRRMIYNDESLRWFENNDWTYMGEFSARKDKLKRLNELSKMK